MVLTIQDAQARFGDKLTVVGGFFHLNDPERGVSVVFGRPTEGGSIEVTSAGEEYLKQLEAEKANDELGALLGGNEG